MLTTRKMTRKHRERFYSQCPLRDGHIPPVIFFSMKSLPGRLLMAQSISSLMSKMLPLAGDRKTERTRALVVGYCSSPFATSPLGTCPAASYSRYGFHASLVHFAILGGVSTRYHKSSTEAKALLAKRSTPTKFDVLCQSFTCARRWRAFIRKK